MATQGSYLAASMVMRDLGYGRLSRDTDESTSEERQNEAVELTVKIRGDRLVGIPFDSDVSGDASPFDRERLGPWLTDPVKIAQWDVLVVAKLDRLTRSLFDFADLVRWLDKNGKILISVSEGIDMSKPAGRMIANVLVAFAQFELERMGERRREAAVKLRAVGRMGSGRPAYGYMRKEGDDRIRQNPDTAPIVRRIVNEVIDGLPMSDIAERLTAEGVQSPYGSIWRRSSLRKLLASRALRGELQHKGHSVLDTDGNPVKMTDEPLITESEWALLDEALDERRRTWGKSPEAHLLLRIAYCGECGEPMYHQHNGNNDYYRCHGNHGLPGYRAERLEEAVTEDLLRAYGHYAIERRAATGKDYASELRLTEKELAELDAAYVAHNISIERYSNVSRILEARRSELQILVRNAQEANWEPTGETVAQRWQRSDIEARHMMLRRLGARWELSRVYRLSDHGWRWEFVSTWLPHEDSHERLTRVS